jgi:hypothetical protein
LSARGRGEVAKPIKVDEWLQELASLSDSNPEGFTVTEVADKMDRCASWAREMIRRGMAKGLVVMVGHRSSRRIDGVPCFTPVYRMAKKGRER